jgi:hypothetical protein
MDFESIASAIPPPGQIVSENPTYHTQNHVFFQMLHFCPVLIMLMAVARNSQ